MQVHEQKSFLVTLTPFKTTVQEKPPLLALVGQKSASVAKESVAPSSPKNVQLEIQGVEVPIELRKENLDLSPQKLRLHSVQSQDTLSKVETARGKGRESDLSLQPRQLSIRNRSSSMHSAGSMRFKTDRVWLPAVSKERYAVPQVKKRSTKMRNLIKRKASVFNQTNGSMEPWDKQNESGSLMHGQMEINEYDHSSDKSRRLPPAEIHLGAADLQPTIDRQILLLDSQDAMRSILQSDNQTRKSSSARNTSQHLRSSTSRSKRA